MIVLRWAWFLIGASVMLQYFYWAALEVGYGLGWCAPPNVDHTWLFLAFMGAAFTCGDRLKDEFLKLIGRPITKGEGLRHERETNAG